MADKLGIIIGAGPGLGLALTRRFAKEGFKMAMIARNEERLKSFEKELSQEGFETAGYAADVSDFTDLNKTLDRIESDHGEASLLIYNVSVLNPGKPTEVDLDSFMNDFKVNVAALLVAAQKLVTQLEGKENPTILVTGGGLALNPFYEYASLAVGKSALRSLTQSLSQELKHKDIHVGTVIINGMIEEGSHFDPSKISDEFWDLYSNENRRMEKEFIYN